MGVLTKQELDYLEESLRRKANEIEQDIVGAEWSEHCSYKSSKKYLRLLPTKASSVVVGSGYDAGVLDVGDGFFTGFPLGETAGQGGNFGNVITGFVLLNHYM